MHGGGFSEDEPMAEINMIPLIDIALTLLIILMVTTTFARKPGVSLKLPETVTREGAQETPKDLTVAVASNGDLYLDGQLQTAEQMQAKLRELAVRDKEARVMIRGDRAVIYSRMMEVMDMIRQAGLTRVVLPTDPKTLQQPLPTGAAATPTRGVPFREQGNANPNATGTANPVQGTQPNDPMTRRATDPTTQQPNNLPTPKREATTP